MVPSLLVMEASSVAATQVLGILACGGHERNGVIEEWPEALLRWKADRKRWYCREERKNMREREKMRHVTQFGKGEIEKLEKVIGGGLWPLIGGHLKTNFFFCPKVSQIFISTQKFEF